MLMENILDISPQWQFGLEKVNPAASVFKKFKVLHETLMAFYAH